MEASEQIKRFSEFFDLIYSAAIVENLRKGNKFLIIDFAELIKFDPELAEQLLEEPDEVIRAAELAIEDSGREGDLKKFKVRFRNLPKTQQILVRNIRSNHIGKLFWTEGIVRQKSDVRPQAVVAKFECPACGNTISVPQLDKKFREPSRCGCGKKGRFRLLSKELVDVQGIVLEEAPEDLEGGDQPKRMQIFLQCDLVSPLSEKRTSPGSKIRIGGIIKEVPITLQTGGQSTRFDLLIEANCVEGVEENFSDITISKEELKTIKELAEDPKIYARLINSIAPSIYGHERIKEALILQLMGGLKKDRKDGVSIRGDIHILLIGDPGCIAGDSQIALIYKGMEKIQNLGNSHLQPIREIVTKIRRDENDKYYDFATIFQHYLKQPVLRVVTETGKDIVCTYNQPFLTKEGWKRADEILLDTEIRVMPKIPTMVKKLVPTGFKRVEKKSGHLKEVALPDKFTPELASLCGYIVGDGHIHKKGYTVVCYINDKEKDIIRNLSEFCEKTFNVVPSITTKNINGSIKTIDDGSGLLRQIISKQQMHVLEVNSRQVAQSLSFLSNKRVPQQIFRSPKPVIAKFISWLFEADGCAFGNGRGRTSIQLKSSTGGLLRDVQLLLLYFGIQSRVISDNLCIRRSYDMELFAKHIGFNSEKKKKALNNVLEVIKNKNNAQKRKRPQRYEKIVKIEPAGIRDVYDFEVPVSHTFIANGIVCHNSGKSQLLKRVSKISPKGRYVSGKGVSGAGLTATVVKDEFLRGWSLEAGALVLANKGLCLTGDTSILLADGSVVPMQQVYEEHLKGKEIHVQSLDTKTFEICKRKVVNVSQRIAEKLLEIKFDTGDKLHITPEHPLPVWDNGLRWVSCGKLKAGASVVLPTEFISKKDVENAALLELCGMIATDGHLTKKKYGISFYSAKKWMIERAKYLINACFGKEMHVHKNNRGSLHAHIGSKEIHEKIKNFGIPVGKKNGLMDCVLLNLSHDDVKAFIIGAINGDGSISNRKGGGIVSLITQNCQTAETYRKLLRKIGVIGRIRKIFSKGGGVVKKGEYSIFHVCITGRENIAKLWDSRLEPTKLAALNKILERRSMDGRIPHVDKLIESARAELKHGQKQALYGNGIKQSQLDDGYGVKRGTLQRALEALAALLILPANSLQALKNVAQDNVHIGKIVSLKEIPPAEVFNLQTDAKEDPNYIANFIPVHNCMIDELDKMSTEDRSAMHEALEQQSVSISKANIQATLRAETTVLAAANPKFGRFDPYGEAISKQINLPTTLINRFDLIFAIKDLPQQDRDEKMAKFILGLHQNPDVENVELDTKLLRKYIAYARQNVHPKLSDGASEEIQIYYLKMRASGTVEGEMKSIPISARQLEALVRLSEASAKVRLSDTVTRKDAKRAIDILHYCLSEIALDKETGQIDIDRISTGIPSSERSKITIIKDLIDKLSEKSKQIAVQDLIDMAKEKNIDESDVDEVIERLKRSGDIFEPKPALIQKI